MRRETSIASLLIVILLGCSFATYGTAVNSSQNISAQNATVAGHSLNEHSWNATVDFLDFLRAKFPSASIPSNMSMNVYTVWLNESSIPLQMLYLGFQNFTYGSQFNITTPLQLILEHFTTPNGTNVVLASSFMMLMAHQDSPTSIIANVPDKNDAVWVSLSIGSDNIIRVLKGFNNTINPNMNVSAKPLQANSSTNHYEWGMRYTNLASLWFQLDMKDTTKGYGLSPLEAVSILSELTFIYKMDINPPTATSGGNVTIHMSYRIGKFTDLWVAGPLYLYIDYFNETTSATLYQAGIHHPAPPTNKNITDFLSQYGFKLSLAFYQKAAVVSGSVTYRDNQNNTASNTDENMTVRKVGAYLGGKQMLETGLGTAKVQYQLDDKNGPHTYDSVAYTRSFDGLRNHNLFAGVSAFMFGVLKWAAIDMEPRLPSSVSIDFASSDFIFTVSYPMWGGYTIIHDPYFAVYTSPTGSSSGPSGASSTMIIVAAVAVVLIAAAVVVMKRRK